MNGDTAYTVPTAKLTVNYPGVEAQSVTVSTGGSAALRTGGWTNGTAVFTVFDGLTYDITVNRYGMAHEKQGLTVNGDTAYTVPTAKLTVNYPGVEAQSVTILTGGSAALRTGGWTNGTAAFTVFDGLTYDISVNRYAMDHTGTGIFVSGDTVYNVPFTTLTVSFPGATGVTVILAKGGTEFGKATGATDSAQFRLFQGNTFDLTATLGSNTHTGTVACSADSQTYDVPLGDLGIVVAAKSTSIAQIFSSGLQLRVSALVSLITRLLRILF